MLTKDLFEFTEIDFDIMLKVLKQFERLYKLCDDKKIIDRCLLTLFTPALKIKKEENNQ